MLAGSGGVGQVFRAHDRLEDQLVALKVLRPPSARDVERFAREVRVLQRVQHPAIVRYVAHGRTAENDPYLAMEWLEGEDLAARLARSPLTVAESVELVRRAAEALAAAHAHGVVHRDIKPSNLFLCGERLDDLKVLDFGLAWLVDASRELTRTGLVVGTLGYMAPEQALGERIIDARTDVFALGCVLYRCVTGRPAFDSDRIGAVLMKILHEDPPRLSAVVPGVPQALDDLAAQMLAKEPSARPANGTAVADALAEILPTVPRNVPRSRPPAALTFTERRFACFVAVGKPHDLLSPEGPDLLVLFDVGAEQRDAARTIAEQHGGQLEALGDGTLLVTMAGASSATDLASQGARCALALRVALGNASIAVTMGRTDQASGRIVSSALQTASSLLSLPISANGKGVPPVHVDATTAGLLDPSFEVTGDDHGLLLLGERSPVERPRLLLGKPTPCVGRERELAALRGAYEECVGEGVARFSLVTGPPGSGKSRVRRELLRGLREGDEKVEIWVANGQPLGAGAPFALVGGIVRAAARLTPEDVPSARRQKLLARVQRNMGRTQGLRTAAFLGEVALAPFPEEGEVGALLHAARADAALMAEQVRRAWQDLLIVECTAQPVVLVLEDMHWGDRPSMGLVMGALRKLSEQRLFVLGFARPEVHDVFPKLARDSGLQEVRLGELTSRASERLLRAVVGDTLPSVQIAAIVERAGGNPFYLEELVRATVEGHGAEVPETVLAMVQTRLAALDPEARRVLRAASILGPRFHVAGVRALVGGGGAGDEVVEWLRVLTEAELLEQASGAWEDAGELTFRHWIVRQAVYETLADHDRQLGHRLAAEWLAEQGKGEPAAIAQHFERADDPGRAAEWHLRAAEAALLGEDFTTAVAQAEQGIQCGAQGEMLGALRTVEMRAHVFLGDPETAEPFAVETLSLLPAGSVRWCAAAAAAGALATLTGKWARLFEKAARMLQVEPAEDARHHYVAAAAWYGLIFYRLGFFAQAERFRERIEALLAQIPESDAVTVGWAEAVRAYRAGVFDADPFGQRDHARRGAESFEKVGDRANGGILGTQMGAALLAMGAHQEACAALRATIAKVEQVGAVTVACVARSELAYALAVLGHRTEAQAQIAEAMRLAGTTRNLIVGVTTQRVRLEVAIMCGDRASARSDAEALASLLDVAVIEGTEAADDTGAVAWTLVQVEIALTLARLHLAERRPEEALALTSRAMKWRAARGGVGHAESALRLSHARRRSKRRASATSPVRLAARRARACSTARRRSRTRPPAPRSWRRCRRTPRRWRCCREKDPRSRPARGHSTTPVKEGRTSLDGTRRPPGGEGAVCGLPFPLLTARAVKERAAKSEPRRARGPRPPAPRPGAPTAKKGPRPPRKPQDHSTKPGEARRPDGPRPDTKRPEGKRPDGPRTDAKRPGGKRPDGHRSEGHRPGGKRPEGHRPGGHRPGGKRPEGHRPGAERAIAQSARGPAGDATTPGTPNKQRPSTDAKQPPQAPREAKKPLPPKKKPEVAPEVDTGPIRTGAVALIGRANVGKSTLLNAALGQSLAITSPVPQTTRDTLLGVLHRGNAELRLLDTPGLHKPKSELGRVMNHFAREAARGADVVVFVAEVSPKGKNRGAPHPGDLTLLQSFKEAVDEAGTPPRPIILALNKVDLAKDKGTLLPLIDALSKVLPFTAIVPFSARREGDADRLMKVVADLLPEGPWQFGPDDLTDRPTRYFAAEYVREQILRATRLEVPHAAAVTIERFVEAETGPVEIDVLIHVERPGQKKILIGRGGETMKRIGTAARLRVKEMLGRKVILKTWVRVTPAWRANAERLAEMGYEKKPQQEGAVFMMELPDDLDDLGAGDGDDSDLADDGDDEGADADEGAEDADLEAEGDLDDEDDDEEQEQ